MTAHPSWCRAERCDVELVGYHQREYPVVGDESKPVASIVLRMYRGGAVRVEIAAWERGWGLSPRTAELVALRLGEVLRVVDGMAPAV